MEPRQEVLAALIGMLDELEINNSVLQRARHLCGVKLSWEAHVVLSDKRKASTTTTR
jgi:hypothetical protein